MSVVLGSVPQTLKVVLVPGADFVSILRRQDGLNWPVADLILEFLTDPITEWTADIVGAVATWNIDQNDVDELLALKPRGVKLWYVEGDLRLLWAQGEVDRR